MRAALFTVASVSLGLSAHVLAGGSLPPATTTAGLVLLVWVTAAAMSRDEVRGGAIVVGVGATQLATHVAAMTAPMPMAMSGGATQRMAETPTMLAAHTVAAVAVVLLLRHAEAGWQLLRRLLSSLVRPVPGALKRAAVTRTRPVLQQGRVRHDSTRHTCISRRGPPVAAVLR